MSAPALNAASPAPATSRLGVRDSSTGWPTIEISPSAPETTARAMMM